MFLRTTPPGSIKDVSSRRPAPRASRRGARRMIAFLGGLAPAILLILHLTATGASAQIFGKNKVQYKNFSWSVIRTEHFEVYFYESERQAALDAARMGERSYQRLSRVLGHQIDHPVPLILYASHSDFQQSNVITDLIDEGTGGYTESFKQRVFLPFTGSYAELEHVLTHELVHAFQYDILFGEGMGLMTNPFTFQPPLWLMEGMAECLSQGGLDPTTKMWLRDGALEGYLVPISVLNQVQDIRVYRFGQSLCDFIARRYGEEKLGDLLRQLVEARGLNQAVEGALGVSVDRLSDLWMEEVRRTYLPEIASHRKAEDFATRLTEDKHYMSHYNLAPEVSPRGDRVVFVSDRNLYQDVYLGSTIDGRVLDRLVKGERSGDLESLRFLEASLAWSPDEKAIAFVAKVREQDVIFVLDMEKKTVVRQLRFPLDGLSSVSWSADGETLAFMGLQGGQSDLYTCRVDGGDLRRLTQDRYMDRQPRWSPDGRRLAFVTDRGAGTDFDSLRFAESRIAIYDLDSGTIEVLPGQEGNNFNPCWSPDGQWLAFISDRTGIFNVFAIRLETGETFTLTDVLSGITGITPASMALSWSAGGDRMVFCAYSRLRYDLYTVKNPLEMKKPYVPAVASADKAEAAGSSATGAGAAAPGARSPEAAAAPSQSSGWADTLRTADIPLETAAAGEKAVASGEATVASRENPAEGTAGGRVVVADSLGVLGALSDSLSVSPQAVLLPEAVPGPEVPGDTLLAERIPDSTETLPDTSSFAVVPYRVRFTRDFAAGGAIFASNIGFAGQTALGFSDILGNHNIYIAASVFGSLSDSDLLVSYSNLSRRTNYGLALFQYRDDFLIHTANDTDSLQSRIYRGVQLSFSRPFSKFVRMEGAVEATAVSESVFRAWYYGGPVTVEPHGTRYFLCPSMALVTDNVIFGYTGPLSGSRSRWQLDRSWGDISNLTWITDYRRYCNIRHRYVLSFRGIGAFSQGRDPEIFRIGGPFTFRGADWGELIGTHVAVTNLEFRFPLIDRLQLVWPLALDFRGIQGVLFLDTAGAWTDELRIWRDGHLADPLAAYGFGARLNLGIVILRYDVAQATDLDRRVGQARHSFTIGSDF